MQIVTGRIVDWMQDGTVVIRAAVPNTEQAILRKYDWVQVGIDDGRSITPLQRRKIYALIRDIAEYVGDHQESVKELMKWDFVVHRMQSIEKRMFSLRDCSETTAREFITFLIDFIVDHGVPCRVSPLEQAEDVSRYVYRCLMNKACCICGRPADLHHVDAIGVGRNRLQVLQIGMPVLPLCRIHHSESHSIGQDSFLAKYHVTPIELTREIGRKYKLTRRNLGGGKP